MDAHVTVVERTTDSALVAAVSAAFRQALAGQGKLNPAVLALAGMSGRKYRLFLNNLIGVLGDPRYLEVGVLEGSTFCSAIDQNRVTALAIDDWSQFGGPARSFFTNLAHFKHAGARVSFLESDFRAVDYRAIGRFNVYMFDGPHGVEDQRHGIALAVPALDSEFVLIVDDWNWSDVRRGTMEGIAEAGLVVEHRIEVRTTLDDTHGLEGGPTGNWHNGYFIAVLSKPG